MLASLEVRDFAHIAAATLELPPTGFCVLTGETGVGKSLLVDALALALGGRQGRNVVRAGATEAEVAVQLDLAGNGAVHEWLERQGLGGDGDQVVVRRVIGASRRSRAYVNGHLATLAQLAGLSGHLVGICGQHEHLQLHDATRRRGLLDATAGTAAERVATAAAHGQWQAVREQLAQARELADRVTSRIEELEDWLEELERVDITAVRLEEQERVLSMQGNAAELAELHAGLRQGLAATGQSLSACHGQATRLGELDDRCAELARQLGTIQDLHNDASRDAARLGGGEMEVDAAALAEAESFVAATHRLARRYRLAGPEVLPGFIAGLQEELAGLGQADVAASERQLATALAGWRRTAGLLSAKRTAAAGTLGRKVQASLRRLGMPEARFAVALTPLAEPAVHGAEAVAFTFAARRSSGLDDLAAVASGGELSRISLALLTHAAGTGGRDLVFDEVDAGVGGKAAAHVGNLLAELGRTRLVLCVTHLPQVAAAAACHWRVVAALDGTASFAQVAGGAREEEVARMLAGHKVTKASRDNAKDILAAAAD